MKGKKCSLFQTPDVFFIGMDLPYTYEDLFGFFKDTKKLSLHSTAHITKQEICQLVQVGEWFFNRGIHKIRLFIQNQT